MSSVPLSRRTRGPEPCSSLYSAVWGVHVLVCPCVLPAEVFSCGSHMSWLYRCGKYHPCDSSTKGAPAFRSSIPISSPPFIPFPAVQCGFPPFGCSPGGFSWFPCDFSTLLQALNMTFVELLVGSSKRTNSHAWFVLWASDDSTVKG